VAETGHQKCVGKDTVGLAHYAELEKGQVVFVSAAREEKSTTDREMHDNAPLRTKGERVGLQLNIVDFCIRGNLCHQ